MLVLWLVCYTETTKGDSKDAAECLVLCGLIHNQATVVPPLENPGWFQWFQWLIVCGVPITKEVLVYNCLVYMRVQAKVQPSCHFEKPRINFNGYIHREWKRGVGNIVVVLLIFHGVAGLCKNPPHSQLQSHYNVPPSQPNQLIQTQS